MNRCPDNSEWVLYAAGEVEPGRRRALEVHLESCAACRREAAGLARGFALLGALPREPSVRPEAMETLRRRLRVAAAHKPARPAVVTLAWRYGWVAAAAAILVVAGVWSLRAPPAQTPQAWISDTQVTEELAEISASVELLEAGAYGKTMEPAVTRPNGSGEDSTDDLEQFMEFLRAEMDA